MMIERFGLSYSERSFDVKQVFVGGNVSPARYECVVIALRKARYETKWSTKVGVYAD